MPEPLSSQPDYASLTQDIKRWGTELGFQDVGITNVDLGQDELHLKEWLAKRFHGSMNYMEAHGHKRSRPAELLPGTLRVISVRLDYTDTDAAGARALLNMPERAYVSRYALGRDYHKVLRQRLKKLASQIEAACAGMVIATKVNDTKLKHIPGSISEPLSGPIPEPIFEKDPESETGPAPRPEKTTGNSDSDTSNTSVVQQRVFVDSAPVLEKALARNAGLGWIGKHTNLINHQAGSWFFLGELFTNLPLKVDTPATNHCGSCTTCLDVCPTQAIVAPYQVDARRCISYLTIENKGSIPEEFRKPMGNRIYGCDDCQLFCPWNKFANSDVPEDFKPRHKLDSEALTTLFGWSAQEFDKNTQGSAIRRTGYRGWLRNIAVALGNAPCSPEVIRVLELREQDSDPIVREHVAWALAQHTGSRHNKLPQ